MSFRLPSSARTSDTRPAWSGMALTVEAMLLLVFLIGSLAIVTQLFAASTIRARDGRQLAEAVALATTEAERFAANPTEAGGTTTEGELTISCDVTSESTDGGTLYHATITVVAGDTPNAEPLYVLNTARYQQEVQ